MLCKNQIELAHDIKTAIKAKISGFKTNVGYFKDVLLPHKYADFLQLNKTDSQVLSFDEQSAKVQLREMETSITPIGTRALLWFFNKSFRHTIRGLFVEVNSLVQNVKEPLGAGKTIILMPIYRSWADFFILTYI